MSDDHNSDLDQVERIFHEVAGVPAEQRPALLDSLCAGDSLIREEVEQLLGCLERAADRLDTSPVAEAVVIPMTLGNYRILRQIGRGGMGEVYEAEQANPRRLVALKVIRAGLAGPKAVRRFEQEATVLGQLKHPGIAQIFESGSFTLTFPGGPTERRPYLAMELLRGQPLDLAARTLDAKAKLSLVTDIADAVHHAHQRGVIHRDLKPANIIVETSDTGILTPKILDFGIARLTGSDAPAAATLVTEAGQIMGTLGFMSPEQVRNEPHEIDVRTDIYALGATLYLLLAGRMPLDLGSKSAFDAAKAVIEEDPPRLGQLAPACRGDVETIVAKAIHKDKEQRYASAAEFAADIRRYLSDEPIAARPPSASYVLRKFASRNKLIVASAAAILLMLAGSSVALSVMYSKAERDRQAAVNARAKAQEETRNLNETVSFLIDDTFGEANPSRKGPSLKVVDVLQDAAAKLDHRFETNPRLRGHVRAIMGTLFNATAQFDLEQAQLTKAIEELDSAGASSESITIGAILQLANTTNLDGQLDKSERLCRDAIARCDPASEDAAEILTAARSVLGESLQKQGRHEEAQRELRGALLTARPTTPKQWDNTIAIRLSLVASLSAQGRVQEIDPLLQETLAVCRAHMPEDAPSTIATLHWISNRLLQQDKFAEADPMALDIVARIERCYSSDHPNVAFACMSAATIKSKIGDLASAVSLSTRSFDILRKHFDEGDFNIEKSAGTVAALIEDSGDVARSLPYYAIFLRARLLAARADERAGVVDRTMQYLMRAAHVRQKGSPPTIEDLLAWVEECRLHTPLIVKEGGLTRSPHAARLLANLAVSAAAFKPQDEHAMSIARSLAAEARAALQASERIEEDTALVSSVEQELAKNQTGRQ